MKWQCPDIINVILLQIWNKKLHKSKVTHVEFSPRDKHILCTASIDHTVKIWDLRMINDKKSFLCELKHERGLNSGEWGGNKESGCMHIFIGVGELNNWELNKEFALSSASPESTTCGWPNLWLLCCSVLQSDGWMSFTDDGSAPWDADLQSAHVPTGEHHHTPAPVLPAPHTVQARQTFVWVGGCHLAYRKTQRPHPPLCL